MIRALTVIQIIGWYIVLSMVPFGLWVWFFQLPGTLGHELCHWIIAWIWSADPHGFTLWPVFENGGLTLGSVRFNATDLNTASVALAPLLLIPVSMFMTRRAFNMRPGVLWIVVCYCTASALHACIPSGVDISLALSHPISLIPAFLAATFIILIDRLR